MKLSDPLVLRLVFDTAALVLIWLVQLVIYPAYAYYPNADFRRWHPVYTRRVTLVVMPIMLGQVAVYLYALWCCPTWDVWTNASLISTVWAVTFFGAVPLHGKLDQAEDHLPPSTQLQRVNTSRTVLWTTVWVLTLLVALQ